MNVGAVKGAWRTRLYWASVAALLALMGTLQFTSVRQESQTADEGRQLVSGYSYLTTGHFTMAREHPPLLKLLWAIPVWFLHPDPPHEGDAWVAAADFLYKNRVPADTMLMAGRSSAIFVSLLLGLAIAFWTRRHFGIPAALFALFLYALDPNFLAHGRYIKNDVGAALAIFGVTMVWGSWLAEPTRKRLWLSGIVLGLALVTKSSALILGPTMLVLYCLHRWQQRRPVLDRQCFRVFGTLAILAFLVIFLVYGGEFAPAGREAFRSRPALAWLGTIPLPGVGYFRGLANILGRETGSTLEDLCGGGPCGMILMGSQSPAGWWYMSFVALAVKTPLAEIGLFLLALAVAARRLRTLNWRRLSFRWFLLTVPAALYFAASLVSHSNAGERHLLPLLPFVFVLISALLATAPAPLWRRVAIGIGAVVLIAETASIHPHYLAFFNAVAGGPAGGRDFLVDSNLDWGQDLKNLKVYFDQHGIHEAYVYYYGWPPPAYYGVPDRPLRAVPTIEAADALNGVAAISVTYLEMFHRRFAGLDAIPPDARIGYSIYVYDLRKHPDRQP